MGEPPAAASGAAPGRTADRLPEGAAAAGGGTVCGGTKNWNWQPGQRTLSPGLAVVRDVFMQAGHCRRMGIAGLPGGGSAWNNLRAGGYLCRPGRPRRSWAAVRRTVADGIRTQRSCRREYSRFQGECQLFLCYRFLLEKRATAPQRVWIEVRRARRWRSGFVSGSARPAARTRPPGCGCASAASSPRR